MEKQSNLSNIIKYRFIQNLKDLDFVEKIIIFGSRARGDNAERADIDLAIVCPEASNKDWSDVLQLIDDADTLLKIDCIRFDKLQNDPLIKKNIENEGIVIYEKSRT